MEFHNNLFLDTWESSRSWMIWMGETEAIKILRLKISLKKTKSHWKHKAQVGVMSGTWGGKVREVTMQR